MTKKEAMRLVKIASEYVPMGIYAIQKNGYIELRNDPMDKDEIRKARKEYGKMGMKVYFNG